MRIYLCMALIGFGCVLAARGAAIPHDPTVPDSMGVNIHFTDPRPGEMDMLADAGFKWVRMDFGWDGTERIKGEYDFSAYDRLLALLDARQMHALLIFDYKNRNYDDGLSPFTDDGRAAFARWSVAAAEHFKGRGVLWEMYNEPNGGFWKPKADANAYAKLAVAVGKALHDAVPDETYIGPASAGFPLNYIQTCFDAGVLNYFSAVTVHPYRQEGPETVAADYATLRSMITHSAPPGKNIPIISGEWGYSERFRDQNEVNQGKTLAREFLTNLAEGIPLSIWYDWHDDGEDPKDPEHRFGIVHSQVLKDGPTPYAPKPAYAAAKTLSHLFARFRFEKRVKVGAADDYVLLFGNGSQTGIAAWTTAADSHDVKIPVQGSFEMTSHVGDQLGQKSAAADGVTLKLSDAPLYLLPAAH